MSAEVIPEVIRVILKDGHTFKLRSITPGDREKLRAFFYRLSPLTRYFRFGYTKEYISDKELAYYTEVLPPDTHAYIGLTGDGADEELRAVGRWYLTEDRRVAEIAFVVEDNIQARGIGTALLEKLAETAMTFKIRKFIARVLPENTRMLGVFEESGFKITKQVLDGVYVITFDLEVQEELSMRQQRREHIARSAGMRRIFYPKSIAVIGASRNTESVGGKVFRNILYSRFSGTVFPVNPLAPSINGVLCYPTVNEVPGDVDLAVIIVPATKVLEVVDQCAKKGVWGLIVISAGFAESGPDGRELQRLLREKVFSYGMRCIGPNCLGIVNTDPQACLNATFAPGTPPRGTLSIGSHSGALGLALLDYVESNNLGVAHFASIGNRIDVSSNDLLEFWEDDENTRVILLYLESFGNTRRFSRIARRITRKKPIIAVKSGRSDVGGRAASSHTGALAAADIAVDALFRQAGVIRVDTIEEMFNVAKVLASQSLPGGPRIAILTNAGGPGVLAADAAVGRMLSVPTLSEATQEKLAAFLPKTAALANPVDMIASAPAEHFEKSLGILLDDPDVDAVLVINIPLSPPQAIASGIAKAMAAAAGKKPVLASFMTAETQKLDFRYGVDGIVPAYLFPEDAVQALAHAWSYAEHRRREEGNPVRFGDIDEERARNYIRTAAMQGTEGGWLPPEVTMGLLREYGIPTADTRAAFSPEEAAETAKAMGFPVVVKLRSLTLTHKTDIGGIVLDVKSEEAVRQAYLDISQRLERAGQGEAMQGVILQPMLSGGQEVIVGMSQDPVFGPLLMVGLGGVYVELIRDVAFSLHPLTDRDPDYMLEQLKSLPLLTGWRGTAPKDVASLKKILLRFSSLIEDFNEIAEMEINPLMVFEDGRGSAVIDARILCNPDAAGV